MQPKSALGTSEPLQVTYRLINTLRAIAAELRQSANSSREAIETSRAALNVEVPHLRSSADRH